METFFRHLPPHQFTDRFCATQITVEQITPTTNTTTTKETAVTEVTAVTKVKPHQNRWRRKENLLQRFYHLTVKSTFNKCGNSVAELQTCTQGGTQSSEKRRRSSVQISRVLHEHRWPLSLTLALALLICNIGQMVAATPVFVDNPSIAQFQSGRNIRHLPCIVRKSGRSGVCMFAIDCIKRNGTHLGTCIDRFYFGSCCQMQDESILFPQEISDNSIDQNTISHFAHDSTALPTNSLFKLTTENVNYVTNREASTFNSSSVHSATTPINPTSVSSSSPRPTTDTTHHKISQFVVRTTSKPKPTLNGKPTIEPTTIKPPKRKTTTRPVVLNTTASLAYIPSQLGEAIGSTTQPEKIFTPQAIETTTGSHTDATNDILTADTWTATARPRPSVGVPLSATNQSTTRHPPITKKPAFTNTTTPKLPSSLSNETGMFPKPSTTALPVRATSSPDTQNATSIIANITTTRTTTASTVTTVPPTTSRPARPKPKPTAEILKVPRPTTGVSKTTTRPAPTTTTTTTETTTMKRPITNSPLLSTDSDGPKESTTLLQLQLTTSASTAAELSAITTTTTEKLLLRPTTTTESSQVKVTTSMPETSGDPTPTITKTVTSTRSTPAFTTTTEFPKVVASTTTTIRPGLVTWTNVAGELLHNMTIDEEWQPRPPPPDWVPLPTIAPVAHINKTTTTITTNFEDAHTEVPESGSTEKTVIVSVPSSGGDSASNASANNELGSVANHTTDATANIKPTSSPTTTAATTTTAPTTTTDKHTNESTESDLVSSTANATGMDAASPFNGTHPSITSTLDDGSSNATTTSPLNQWEGVDYRQICGRRMFPEPRIVGGANAAFGRWPWQISLRQWRTSTYLHKCGAALLNENWAITAAHCVDNVPPSDLLMRLGEYDLAEEEEPYGYQERRVQIVASHPQFDPRTFEYDLALLRFYEPVLFQPNIIPVCVPDSDHDFIGQTAFVTGWGRLYEDGPLPSVLQEVAVPVINNTICEAMYRAAGYIEHIPHIFICAGWKKGGYDSCEGDSGGPMVLQREEDKRFQLGGVISWGIGCAEVNQPGVYTRISEFRDWINQILQF